MNADHRIAVIGGGKIGELVIALLAGQYRVSVYDLDLRRAEASASGGAAGAAQLDVNDEKALLRALENKSLVINCCPHYCNLPIARAACRAGVSYLDLSEDVETGNRIEEMARDAPGYFVPRCGIAPGFIQIVASHIMQDYETVEKAHLRVGALPDHHGLQRGLRGRPRRARPAPPPGLRAPGGDRLQRLLRHPLRGAV